VNLKLTEDERDALRELVYSPGWEPLLKVVEQFVATQERKLVSYNLKEGPEGLVHARAALNGADMLRADLNNLKKLFKVTGEN
jgi:hypothetical protein